MISGSSFVTLNTLGYPKSYVKINFKKGFTSLQLKHKYIRILEEY